MKTTSIIPQAILTTLLSMILSSNISAHEGHWRAPADTINIKNPIAADKESLIRGKEIYQSLCTGCHGSNGNGEGKAVPWIRTEPTPLSSHNESDGELFWKIRSGRQVMPGYARIIIRKHIWDVINYIQHTLVKK